MVRWTGERILFFQGINSLVEKWQKCIDVVGDIIEKCHYV